MPARIIFITGTDTGVGKTLVTALLLDFLRNTGCHALAIKPFCSGGLADVDLLDVVQNGELTTRQINPFYFQEPVSPLAAARKHRRRVSLRAVIDHTRKIARHCDFLLVEGAGGLLVPLGEGFSILDLIVGLTREVIVVAPNRLGTINHTLLTIDKLRNSLATKERRSRRAQLDVKVAFTHPSANPTEDAACGSNEKILAELLHPVPLVSIGFLGKNATSFPTIIRHRKILQKVLAQLIH